MAMRCSLGIPWAVGLASVYRKGPLISVPAPVEIRAADSAERPISPTEATGCEVASGWPGRPSLTVTALPSNDQDRSRKCRSCLGALPSLTQCWRGNPGHLARNRIGAYLDALARMAALRRGPMDQHNSAVALSIPVGINDSAVSSCKTPLLCRSDAGQRSRGEQNARGNR